MTKPLYIDELWNERIVKSLNGLEYGLVQIVVHDGRIVQIERTERRRYDNEPARERSEQPVAKRRISI
ncbi:YezD family protein [Paenibacillus sp. MBLB4367]|uniref:YezD family protein n=1 Tax=Paenibacillus sp. MBLB4367 TaxID=3384767 RepID=UPI0039081CD3